MRKIVFDIETKNEVWGDIAAMEMSIVCIYDSETDSYSSYLEEELHKLWPILERADLLIGYNSEHFDTPILNKYYHGDLSKIKHLDLLSEIKNSLGRRVSLDQIAEATLGRGKSGHGLQAIKWWKEGDIDSLRKYCLEDVKITKEVYDFALKNQLLRYKEAGKKFDIKLNTSSWEKTNNNSMTFSLPF